MNTVQTTTADQTQEQQPVDMNIQLAGKPFSMRILKRHLKNAKLNHNFDLAAMDFQQPLNSLAFSLITDPITLLEAFWAYFSEDLEKLGYTEDTIDEVIDQDNFAEIKTKLLHACAGFFPFVTIVSTLMRGLQPGNLTSLQAEIQNQVKQAGLDRSVESSTSS